MTLLITPQDLVARTQLSANIDVQKYKPYIEDVQVKYMGDLLGDTLTRKILSDFEANTLANEYLKVYEILKNIIIYETAAQYILFGQYNVTNGGIFKLTTDKGETVPAQEVEGLSKRYSSKAEIYISQMERYLCSEGGKMPEYNTQDDNYDKRPQRGQNSAITWSF